MSRMNSTDKGTQTGVRLGKIKRIRRLFWTKKRPLQLVPISTEASIVLTHELMVPLPTNSLGCYCSLNDFNLPGSIDFKHFLEGLNKS